MHISLPPEMPDMPEPSPSGQLQLTDFYEQRGAQDLTQLLEESRMISELLTIVLNECLHTPQRDGS